MGSATISRYVSIASNEKIVSIVNTGSVPSLEQLEQFNQNELAKLAKLPEKDFNKVLEKGNFPENKNKNSDKITFRKKYDNLSDKIKSINTQINESNEVSKDELLEYIKELTALFNNK